MMKEDAFDINETRCGPNGWTALFFALGELNEPHDEKAVKLVLGAPGVDVNAPGHLGQSVLLVQCGLGRSRNVELLLADPRVDVNQVDLEGHSPLYTAANHGMDRCVELLLADPRMDVNQVNTITGAFPLFTAANQGRDSCVELLLSDPRVDVNQVDAVGHSPLFVAANQGKDRCLALLLADDRVDVCRASADGMTPLLSACMQLMTSMDQVGAGGGNDPARCLVLMLKSRRLPKHNVEETIRRMGHCMPTRRQIDAAAAGGEPLDAEQKMCRIVIPVLLAHLQGEFRWCTHCLKLTPDVNLHRCGGCKQVGYCDEAPPGQKPCHEAHWKAHKKECKQFQAEEAEMRKAEEDADEGAGGKEGERGGEGGAGGGNEGDGKKKKRGGGKKKKGRRKE
jgi:ankyrin repeat protein